MLLKILGIIFILKGLEGFFSIIKEIKNKKKRLIGRSVSALTNGYFFLTGCFLFAVPFIDIKLDQLYLLGAFYAGLSTIFWIFVHFLEKKKDKEV